MRARDNETMNPAQLVSQGLRHHNAGDLDRAESLYRAALDADPEHADALHLSGVIAHQRGHHQTAIELISKAVQKQPRNGGFLNNLGEAYRAQRQFALAIENYHLALTVNPNDANALNNLGLALHHTHHFDEAESSFEAALQHSGGDPETLMNLGNLYRDQGQLERAIGCYRDAIARAPGFPSAHAWLGVALYEAGQGDAAVASLTQATELDPLNIEAHNNLKRVRWNLDQKDHLQDSFRRACDLLPQVADTHLNLAESLLLSGMTTQAFDSAMHAVQLAPKMARAHSLLGRTQERLGRLDEAIAEHEQALRLAPEDALLGEECANTLLLTQNFSRATEVLRGAHRLAPRRSALLARLGIAMCETDDETLPELVDYERFVVPQLIDVPPGFDSLEQFNAALHQELLTQHVNPNHALEQTMRGGTQSENNLFQNPVGLVAVLKQQISLLIDRYIAQLPHDAEHPFLRYANPDYVFTGAWSTILQSSGFDGSHIHNEGWLSGTYYVSAPELTEQQHADHEGYIQFGEPPRQFVSERNCAHRFVAPQAGLAVLFPSYYWHGVQAFSRGGSRHSVSYDIG